METATAGLHDALRLVGDVTFVDTSFSASNADRGRISLNKARELLRMMSAVRRHEADVAHVPISQNAPGLIRDTCLLRCIRPPAIAYLHGGAYAAIAKERSLRGFLLRYVLGQAHAVACLYERQCDELSAAGIDLPKAAVGNVVPDIRAHPHTVAHDPLRVLFLGLLSRSKGIDVLCNAVRGLDCVSVTAVGEWCPRDRNLKLGDITADLDVPNNVQIRPPVEPTAIPDLLASHDVLVLPSHSEGLPMTVLEAMSSGMPVVASLTGGLRELAARGLMTQLDTLDHACLRDALLEVRGSYDVSLEQASRAQKFVQERYSARSIAKRVAKLRLSTSPLLMP